ncbi:MAG: histone deacetylase [bacterium]|nr:histone deacetylase [bacterium]
MKVVYSPNYYADIGSHVFPMEKYGLIIEKLLNNGIILKEDIIEAPPIADGGLLLVHTGEYINKLWRGTLTHREQAILEIPYSLKLFKTFRCACSGTAIAAKISLKDGCGINVGGGFHHAYPDHGEGFCLLNDIAVGVRVLQHENLIKKALVIDCDLHQGNGTAFIFKNDPSVYTYSIHQENIYPLRKEKSNRDVNLRPGTSEGEYLAILEEDVLRMMNVVEPELIVYVAGADPYCNDQLGGLKVTIRGFIRRDEILFENAKKKGVPIVLVLAGGYAKEISDTVQIHYNAIKKAMELFR